MILYFTGYTSDAQESVAYTELSRKLKNNNKKPPTACKLCVAVYTDLDIALAVQDDVFKLEISVDYAAL